MGKIKATLMKTLALLLLLAMAVVFVAACADEPAPGATPVPTPEPVVDATPEPTPTPEPTHEPTPEPLPEPESDEPGEAEETDDNPFVFFEFPFEFVLVDVHGNTVTNEDLGEKRAFFWYMWETWCPSCIVAMPELARISEEYGDEIGFVGFFNAATGQEIDAARIILSNHEIPENFIMLNWRMLPEEYQGREDEFLELLEPLIHWLISISSGFIPNYFILTNDGSFPNPTNNLRNTIPILDSIVLR